LVNLIYTETNSFASSLIKSILYVSTKKYETCKFENKLFIFSISTVIPSSMLLALATSVRTDM